MKVLGRMLIGRGVAAAHVSADFAHTKMDPFSADFQTLFAAFAAGPYGWINQSEVSAVRHSFLLVSFISGLDSRRASAVTKNEPDRKPELRLSILRDTRPLLTTVTVEKGICRQQSVSPAWPVSGRRSFIRSLKRRARAQFRDRVLRRRARVSHRGTGPESAPL